MTCRFPRRTQWLARKLAAHPLIETVLFPRVYRERGHVLFDQGPFIFRGKVEEEFGAITVTITHLDRLERAAGKP